MSLRNRARAYLKVLGILSMGFVLARCGEDKIDPTYSSLYSNFFNSCGQAGCHVSGNTAYTSGLAVNMNVSQSALYDILVASRSSYITATECNTSSVKIIAPSDYDSSMIKALVGTDSERTALSAAKDGCSPIASANHGWSIPSSRVVEALRAWVAAGALNN